MWIAIILIAVLIIAIFLYNNYEIVDVEEGFEQRKSVESNPEEIIKQQSDKEKETIANQLNTIFDSLGDAHYSMKMLSWEIEADPIASEIDDDLWVLTDAYCIYATPHTKDWNSILNKELPYRSLGRKVHIEIIQKNLIDMLERYNYISPLIVVKTEKVMILKAIKNIEKLLKNYNE